ncbi:MAG: NADPH-dependent 7-cyano-7-deazaguanine reductase QueF [Candidatus Saganbacteria bacterium]|nr:NADPH-dependent 7-cyano-7-deazaguanine reductase QueF [Candidatus Saganbacteria bacterium]
MREYTQEHARAGLKDKLPLIDVFLNSFKGYEITVVIPEFTSICPRSGLPDFGKITIKYIPKRSCIELKSLKTYILGYRNLGIFNENVVNRILKDIVSACAPKKVLVVGEFTPRGGISTIIEVKYPQKK